MLVSISYGANDYRSRHGAYEVRMAYLLPDESKIDIDGALFIDSSAKTSKKFQERYFRYLSDPELVEASVPAISEVEVAEASEVAKPEDEITNEKEQ